MSIMQTEHYVSCTTDKQNTLRYDCNGKCHNLEVVVYLGFTPESRVKFVNNEGISSSTR